tara:strand:- start:387 stop:1223 length:837 start_codon:yes stop_codon:yes gene_type:complete
MSKHNKKRNVGIIYEQLLLSLSEAIVENGEDRISTIKEILKIHFKPGTELYKEFRLFNALVKTRVTSEALVSRILEESRKAAQDHDAQQLRIEKSLLIRDINHKINNPQFYAQKVKEYREYATIQTLLNDWRKSSPDVGRLMEYEGKVHAFLLSEKKESKLSDESDSSINKLTVKLMNKKFNSKYRSALNEEQAGIIQNYIFNDGGGMSAELLTIKENTIRELASFKRKCSNKFLLEKIDRVIQNINDLNESQINDDQIAKFLLISKLKDEILENNNV